MLRRRARGNFDGRIVISEQELVTGILVPKGSRHFANIFGLAESSLLSSESSFERLAARDLCALSLIESLSDSWSIGALKLRRKPRRRAPSGAVLLSEPFFCSSVSVSG